MPNRAWRRLGIQCIRVLRGRFADRAQLRFQRGNLLLRLLVHLAVAEAAAATAMACAASGEMPVGAGAASAAATAFVPFLSASVCAVTFSGCVPFELSR